MRYLPTMFITLGILGGAAFADQSGKYTPSTNPHIDEFLKLVSDLSKMQPELEREKDRRGKLMIELMANVGAGCMFEHKARSIEVSIDGERLSDIDVTQLKSNVQFLPEAQPGKAPFKFVFGDLGGQNQIEFAYDDGANPLFIASGKTSFKVPPEKSFKLGFLDRIKISKDPAYNVKSLVGNKQIKETDRYKLSEITIKIDGFEVYKANPNFVFSDNPSPSDGDTGARGMVWEDASARNNEAFVKLLQVKDCSQSK